MIDGLLEFVSGLTPLQWVYLFWPFFVFDLPRYVLLDALIIFGWLPWRRAHQRDLAQARRQLFQARPLVSVIAPGKNEGRHLARLVSSLQRQTYNNLELVIVDDGSDDNTPELGRSLERRGLVTRFVRNEVRGGKASAANTALHFCRGAYVVHVDADSNLRHDAVEKLIVHFYLDPAIAAVGGDIRVANIGRTMATRVQAIEYMKSISTGRTVSSMLGILRIIAGAYGAFRMDTLQRLGGWDVGPGLDGDMVMRIRKLGLKVVHEPDAVCYTNVPETFRVLARQRFRWDRSMVRFRMRKHLDVMLPNQNFQWLNFASSVENLFYTFFLSNKWWFYLVHVMLVMPGSWVWIFLINYFLYLTTNIIEFGIAMVLLGRSSRPAERRLWFYLPLMPFYMSPFLRTVRTFAQIMELLHRASFRDAWNPWKVSRQVMERES